MMLANTQKWQIEPVSKIVSTKPIEIFSIGNFRLTHFEITGYRPGLPTLLNLQKTHIFEHFAVQAVLYKNAQMTVYLCEVFRYQDSGLVQAQVLIETEHENAIQYYEGQIDSKTIPNLGEITRSIDTDNQPKRIDIKPEGMSQEEYIHLKRFISKSEYEEWSDLEAKRLEAIKRDGKITRRWW